MAAILVGGDPDTGNGFAFPARVAQDELGITFGKPLPEASATASPSPAHAGTTVTLDGGDSEDPDGDALTYYWEQYFEEGRGEVVERDAVTLSEVAGKPASRTFTAPSSATVLTFRLTVTDPYMRSSSDTVAINVVPAAPLNLLAVATVGQIAMTWDDPGDSSITGYEHRLRQEGNDWWRWLGIPNSNSGTTGYTRTGLQDNLEYHVQVRATSASGPGAAAQDGPVAPKADTRAHSYAYTHAHSYANTRAYTYTYTYANANAVARHRADAEIGA